ncbi:ISH3 family transposase [Aphanothece sacrum]|uniref:Transposase n=1 Tax=Aphanothece sacrum FPU1 TaxID=1920663 RepID=A0A401IE09_APHSA|nr:ISH3 family transposase [Aphanothece sacrum]GBF79503.1 transposase [Aphanothece sacrum FPU1]GBF83956.1 transposase [Aphanothece sacrum FPU3]
MTDLNPRILLTESETLEETIDCLRQNIPLETQGAFNASDLYQILVRAASNCDSIENTTKSLKKSPCGKNIRYHLDKFNDFEELETNINSALKSRKLPGIAQKKLKLAIDLNLIPYYGNPTPEEMPYIYRSQAKCGTCSFYAYATLYVIKKGKRLTLAIRGIRQRDTNVAIITYLLASVSSLKIEIKTLYLDRGFFSIAVIRWLKALRIPFMMPAIKTGKTGGIKQFLQGRKSYKTTYTMEKNKEDFVTLDLWIICKYKKGKRKKHGIEYFVYVVYQPKIRLDYIHTDYRRRFGIESSYRIKNICRIKTINKKPVIRLLFIGISFLLVNIWVNLLWKKVSLPNRGG